MTRFMKGKTEFLKSRNTSSEKIWTLCITPSQEDVIFFVSVCRTIFVSRECLKNMWKETLPKKWYPIKLKFFDKSFQRANKTCKQTQNRGKVFVKSQLNLDQWSDLENCFPTLSDVNKSKHYFYIMKQNMKPKASLQNK